MAQIPEKIQKKIALSAFTGKSAIRAIKIDHPNPSVEYVLSFVYYFVDHDNTRIQYIFFKNKYVVVWIGICCYWHT